MRKPYDLESFSAAISEPAQTQTVHAAAVVAKLLCEANLKDDYVRECCTKYKDRGEAFLAGVGYGMLLAAKAQLMESDIVSVATKVCPAAMASL
jgi:hypothetical protein